MPGVLTPAGAALNYLRQKFGGSFREDESLLVIGVAAAQLVDNNPDRLGLLIVNLGANNLFVSLGVVPSAANGFAVAPNGGTCSITVDEDFTLVARQLFAAAPAGNTQTYVLELLREIANS